MNILKKSILTVALSVGALSSFALAGETVDQVSSKPSQKQVIQVSPEEVAAKANWCTYEYLCTPYGCTYRYLCY